MLPTVRERVVLDVAFVDAARRYWLTVFPRVRKELRHWRARAGQIPDSELRRLAIDSLRESVTIEGAAAFAAFAPHARRAAVVRALAAFQAAYNYTDLLAEQPHRETVANGRRLHEALLVALDPDVPQRDYYAHHPRGDDGGYLRELVDTCRTALSGLPSHAVVMDSAQRAAARIVSFQSLNLGKTQGDHEALAQWARDETPPGTGLEWWETAAAAGSSLNVLVLIAAAADAELQEEHVAALDDAYFPWIGALHSLLDNVVDRQEDARTEQHSLVGYYASSSAAAARLHMLAAQGMNRARALPQGRRHEIILAAMAGSYLSTPEANTSDVEAISPRVLQAFGHLTAPTMLVFKLRRVLSSAATRPTAAGGSAATPEWVRSASPISLR
jgi:tetraprenyl-beta-curcumene synthase